MTPHRVQYHRGLKLPEGTVYVGRPSRWGNPFKMAGEQDRNKVCDLFERRVAPQLNLEPLRGKNLACWCPLDKRCHADTLLRMANA